MADIYTKLHILSLCSIFSRAMEIPKKKNHMNKVLTTPLINWTISSKLLTHHEIIHVEGALALTQVKFLPQQRMTP
jgi:hypothetical protein